MNREAFETRVQEILDRRQSPAKDAELLRAAEANPELGRLLQAYDLCGTFRRPRPSPSVDLAQRVLTDIRQAPARPEQRLPAWFAPFIAVAATLLIATTISWQSHQATNAGVAPVAPQANATAQAKPAQRPGLDRLSRQAAANYRELAASTGRSLNSALSVMQPSPKPEVAAAKPAPSQDDWLRSVPGGLRPLSNSTSGAVSSLLRVVPGADDDDRDEF